MLSNLHQVEDHLAERAENKALMIPHVEMNARTVFLDLMQHLLRLAQAGAKASIEQVKVALWHCQEGIEREDFDESDEDVDGSEFEGEE